MYSSNENKTNALHRCWEVFFEGKSIRCSHGGLITVMLLDRLTKGQQSPRKSIFSGEKFASFSHKPLARTFSDEVKLRTSFLLESTVLLCNGGKRRWICLQQEGPYRAWSFRCSFQRTSQKGDLHLHNFAKGKKKKMLIRFFLFDLRKSLNSQSRSLFRDIWSSFKCEMIWISSNLIKGFIYLAFIRIKACTFPICCNFEPCHWTTSNVNKLTAPSINAQCLIREN